VRLTLPRLTAADLDLPEYGLPGEEDRPCTGARPANIRLPAYAVRTGEATPPPPPPSGDDWWRSPDEPFGDRIPADLLDQLIRANEQIDTEDARWYEDQAEVARQRRIQDLLRLQNPDHPDVADEEFGAAPQAEEFDVSEL